MCVVARCDVGFRDEREAAAALNRQTSYAERLEIAGELLAALDAATGAGQSYLMNRVLGIIREELLWPDLRLTGPQLAKVMATASDLEHEVARLAPNPGEFRSRAYGVLEVLSSSARRTDGSPPIAAANGRELGQRRS